MSAACSRRIMSPCRRLLQPIRLCSPRFEQGFECLGEYGRSAAQRGHMKTGHQALTVVQCAQGIDTPLKADIQVQVGTGRDMLLQQG